MADDGRARHRRNAVSIEVYDSVSSGLAIAVEVHLAPKEIGEAGGVESDADAGAGRERFLVKECDGLPIVGEFDAREDATSAEGGEKVIRVEKRVGGQR